MFFRAKLASFYGWTHEYILGMSNDVALEYYEAITVIDAQDRMVDMNMADYPNMKKESRKKFFRQMRKQAYPTSLYKPKEMDFDEFFKVMGHGGRKNNDTD